MLLPDVSEKEVGSTRPVSSPGKPTLLIVDDEEGPRQALRVVFKGAYNILLAENGDRAVRLAREHSVDAAVLDIRMAGLSGIEVLRQIKRINPDTEVIMLTAYQTLETARQALRYGACDYLDKPFDVPALQEAVQKAMGRRIFSREMQQALQNVAKLQEELQHQILKAEFARNRGEIYESIIHDLNGPLAVIGTLVDLVEQVMGDNQRLEGDDLENLQSRVASIRKYVRNCSDICRRYASFLRNHPPEKSRVEIPQILADLNELLWRHPVAQSHELFIEPAPGGLVARINGTDLIQILLNLGINSFQASDRPHRVWICAKGRDQVISAETRRGGGNRRFFSGSGFKNKPPWVILEVADDGGGIAPQNLGRIFEPYFSTKKPESGSGMGLAIVRRLTEQAHGAIEVENDPGRGVRIRIFIPGEPAEKK